jgi:hypothetical protein
MWKRLLWQRTGGHYLFWLSAIYLTVGMLDVFYLEEDYTIPIQLVWLFFMALPLVVKPLARFLNMRTIWETR